MTLPLPPVHPYAQQLYPAANGKLHLLWLDANADGELRLYAALLSDDLQVERGPIAVSDQLALRYTAMPLNDGNLLVLWSGGFPAEPALYAQQIDARGLPRQSTMLTRDADWPTLVRSSEDVQYILWLKPTDGHLHYGILEDESLALTRPIENTVNLEPGDRLHHLTAALDQDYIYLFWNLTRRSGESQSWMLSAPLDTLDWSDPVRLGVDIGASTIETGFNSGQVTSAASGSAYLRQVMPLGGQFTTLPVAAYLEQSLAIAYFQDGKIIGLQRIAPAQLPLEPPGLQTDRERHLYVSWSEPTDDDTAALKMTTTRR